MMRRPANAASSKTATTEPTPSTRNIITEGIHDKRVGQPGGFGCGDGPEAVCDVLLAFQYKPPVTTLMLSHWALETTDGAMHYDLQMVDATFLWLEYEKTVYRWPVRPPV